MSVLRNYENTLRLEMNYIHAVQSDTAANLSREKLFSINIPGANYIIRLHRNYILARLPRYA